MAPRLPWTAHGSSRSSRVLTDPSHSVGEVNELAGGSPGAKVRGLPAAAERVPARRLLWLELVPRAASLLASPTRPEARNANSRVGS